MQGIVIEALEPVTNVRLECKLNKTSVTSSEIKSIIPKLRIQKILGKEILLISN
jgi:hypothetical protein